MKRIFLFAVLFPLTTSSCRTRATAGEYESKEAAEAKGSTNYYCKVISPKPQGTQISGVVGRSKSASITTLFINVPPKENNDGASLGFVSEDKSVSDLKVEHQALDLYNRWGHIARVSGAVYEGENPVLKVTTWFNTVKNDLTGFVEFEEGKSEDPVKVMADMDCR